MRIGSKKTSRREDELMLSAMVDIVFLLLIFFVMTFKITAVEGDLHVGMPDEGVASVKLKSLPIRLRLHAEGHGQMVGISMNDRPLADMEELGRIVRNITAESKQNAMGDELEVILDCDYGLSYRHAIDALTTVSGTRNAAGEIKPLVTNIKFAPPRSS